MNTTMNKIKKISVAFVMVWALMACDLDKLDNPNAVSASNSDVDYVLNGIQLNFAGLYLGMSDYGMQMTRQLHFYGPTYESGYSAASFDGFWSTAYSGILVNTKQLIPVAEEKQFFVHAGIARVIEAYTLMSLVDYFGDVPFTNALDPNEFNPTADDDASVYAAAMTKLDEAIANFAEVSIAKPANDMFYGGSATKWVTLAKSLKLRALIQTSRANDGDFSEAASIAGIEALVTEGDLIDAADGSEDFNFKYSKTISNPDSRHPYFTGGYLQGAGYYMSNYLMNEMFITKGLIDPRIRYYFYRQSTGTSDVNELSCIVVEPPAHYVPEWPFCEVGSGYWGRDFGDFSGTPPDTYKRTSFGAYPAGGSFDNSNFSPVTPTQGEQGAGILPIYNSANTHFMLAEAALLGANVGTGPAPGKALAVNPSGGTNDPYNGGVAFADPVKNRLLLGVQHSIDKVMGTFSITTNTPGIFTGTPAGAPLRIPSPTSGKNYKDKVMALYDAAANDDEKLEVVMKEYWLSLFGNGIDAFNSYRRTGKPGNFQAGLTVDMGKAYRSFTYPSIYVNRNSTATQKADNTVQVFWDTNPANFID